jgi:hypothetical protein
MAARAADGGRRSRRRDRRTSCRAWQQAGDGSGAGLVSRAARSIRRSARSGCRRSTSGAMPTTRSDGQPPKARPISSRRPIVLRCFPASAILQPSKRRIASASCCCNMPWPIPREVNRPRSRHLISSQRASRLPGDLRKSLSACNPCHSPDNLGGAAWRSRTLAAGSTGREYRVSTDRAYWRAELCRL